MVAKKAGKAAKVSYAERVLGAFSKIQREQRKHVIHVATLRAQVKKTAQENKDTLGRNWASWVRTAIQKLEDEGILTASQIPVGNLTLTTAGKKAISAARQSLAVSMHASPSTVPEDLVWKNVTQVTPKVTRVTPKVTQVTPKVTQVTPRKRGLKRGRRSSMRPPNEEDLDTLDGPTSITTISTRSKRARTSNLQGPSVKKPISKMTKAELQAELLSLRRQHDDALWLRASSPLTDLDDDDTEGTNGNTISVNDAESQHRLPTPEMQLFILISDDIRRPSLRPASNAPTPSRPLHGLIRRASGSRISLLSKQPTPAPTSPGAASDVDYTAFVHGHENDEFAMQEDNEDQDSPSSLQRVAGTTTPGTVCNGDALKVLELEHHLGTRVAAIRDLEAQLLHLQENYSKIQQDLLGRDNRLALLSANIVNLETEKALDLDRQSAELSTVRAAKVDLELTYTSRLKEVEQCLQERDASIQSLKINQGNNLAELSCLRDALNTVEQTNASLVLEVRDTKAQVSSLRSGMGEQERSADVELQTQRAIGTELEIKVQELLAKTSELEQLVAELQNSEGATATSLAEAITQKTLISDKLRVAESINESLQRQLASVTDEKSTSEAALKLSKDMVAVLTSQITALNNSISQDKANVADLTQSLAAAKQEVMSLRQQVATTGLSVSTLQSELSLSKQATNELTTNLAVVVDERAVLSGKLEEAQTMISASASSMNQLKERLATTTDQLSKSESAAAELQASLDATTDRLTAQEEQIRGLVDDAESKDREMKALVEKLSVAESRAGTFRAEVTATETKMRDLHSQLAAAQDELSATQELLSSTEATHALQREKQATAISGLGNLLQDARSEVEVLKSELTAARAVSADLQTHVDGQSVELGEARVNLASERQRAKRLESDLGTAISKAQEVEEELSELKVSKEADEATIENLKGMFSTLRENQMKSLAELDSKVVSTKSSPAPKRRSTRSNAAKPIHPLKLT
ncbi:hypothetical protein FPV67DRAFT_1668742 [Lyophyllum atratum]|nr:hypothetical protein FPV67DRAFT_1668742 [Lyophyllum atratum]